MKYVLMFVETEQFEQDLAAMSQDDRARAYALADKWFADHAAVMRGGSKLRPPHTATTVRLDGGGEPVVTDGPFVEGKEVVSGFAEIEVADLDEALEITNRSRYGLDSCVFTASLESAWRAARGLECGQVHVNDAPLHGVGHFPFGGRKPDSGIGREGLGYSIDECTVLKTVVLPT